jgi:ATP-dependent Lon protease
MQLPDTIPVMILPNATLFPQSLLPLYIFEPRYRRMLEDVLHADRMFAIAMQRPGAKRETPSPIAGLGIVRVAVKHKDATSHLVLQGMARVQLWEAVKYKPYRKHRIELLNSPPADSPAVDALVDKLRELLNERLKLGMPFPFPVAPAPDSAATKASGVPAEEIMKYLGSIEDPAHLTDLVSCAVLPDAIERQTILETVAVDTRLRCLIQFLTADIRRKRKKS